MAEIGALTRTAFWAAAALLLVGCPHHSRGIPQSLRVPGVQTPLCAPTPAPSPPRGLYHIIARKETLFGIAKAYNIDMHVLADANNLTPPYHLRDGARLFIPNTSGQQPVPPPMQPAFPASAAQATPSPPPAPETQSNSPAPLAPVAEELPEEEFTGTLLWPVQGEILSEFSPRDGSQCGGITIKAAENTPVRAAAPGRVGHVGTMPGYGNVILIEHPNHMITVYAHLKEIRATSGMTVRHGQVIGTVGSSGRAATPSLYFEVRSQRKPCDPLSVLPGRKS